MRSGAAAAQDPPATRDGRTPWLVNPLVDLVVGCGLWSLPLLALAYAFAGDGSQRWSVTFYALALVCNYPHFMATVYRAYGRADRGRHTFHTVYVTGLLVLAGVAALLDARLVPWLFTAYVFWSPWHYTGQNFGLLMMFLRRAGIPVTEGQRRRIRLAFVASFVLLLAAFNEGPSADPFVLSLGVPVGVAWPLQVLAALVFVVLALPPAWSWIRGGWSIAAVAPITLITTQALWFVVPTVVSWTAAMAIPQTRYSTGILALMHSAQYLWVTQYFTRRDQDHWKARRYWTTLVLGGIALFVPVPWLVSRGLDVDFTQSVLVVTAVVNLHHFVIDGVVWKLRQSRVASVLIDGRRPEPPTPSRILDVSWARRAAGIAAAMALVAVAAVDQWRYWLLARAGVDDLTRAAALTPHDDQVHARLLRTLIDGGRVDEARALLDRMVAGDPRDVDALVNRGVLANAEGDVPTARMHWERALAVRDDQPAVHLYLADLLVNQAMPDEAIGHYRRYLELVVERRGVAAPDPRVVVPVVLRYGDTLARANRPEAARQQFELALRMAQQTGLEAIAAEARKRLGVAVTP